MSRVEVDFKLLVSDGNMTSFVTDGLYEKKEGFNRLTFVEQTDIKALTKIDIYNDKILLDRKGSIHMKMEYIMNESTMVYMKTDFNYELSMSNYTKFVKIEDNLIEVIYQTETDKEQNLTHQLVISWH